jgi:predicted MFS family arabinose efflux permease
MKSHLKINRWALAIIIGMAGGLSFELPYMKVNYQPEMQASLGISATQVGILMSVYGALAILFYTPSGIIADKYNHRNLISINLAITGALAFIMATYPPFPVLLAIQVIWAVTTILFMWSATVKAVSLLGDATEQGGLMGIAEGARGLSCLTAGLITLLIFRALGADANPDAFKGVIIGYGIIMILLAGVCWFIVPDGKGDAGDTEEAEPFTKSDILYVIRQKSTWYSALFVFGIYTSYACLTYTSSYLMDCFGMTMVMATFVGILRGQVFRAFSAPCGSLITMKSPIKSPTRVLQLSAIANTAAFVLLLIFPTNKVFLYIMITIVMVSSFCIFLSRGMYFATIGEMETPKRIVGTTVGVISLIGFLPDAFIYIVIGHWQDTLPAAMAYRNLWITGALGTILGIVMSTLLLRELKKKRDAAKERSAG